MILIVLGQLVINLLGIDIILLMISLLLIGTSTTSGLLRSIVIASLKTRYLPVIMIVSASAKIIAGVVLVLSGAGALGVILSFTIYPVLASILLAVNIMFILRITTTSSHVGIDNPARTLTAASLASWVPAVVSAIGIQLGPIVVFGTEGAYEAGVYFIAFSVATAVSSFMSVVLTVAVPVLSKLDDGRKRGAWKVIKVSLLMTTPFSASLIFYSSEVLQLFGSAYLDGSLVLQILLLPLPLIAVSSGMNALSYAYGNYRDVLSIGLAASIPRALLYFILVPIFGSTGAAWSYTLGSIIGFIMALIVARHIRMNIIWRDLFVLSLLPMSIAFTMSYLHVNVFVSAATTIGISYALFLKFSFLTRHDIQDLVKVLPAKMSGPVQRALDKIGMKLNGSY